MTIYSWTVFLASRTWKQNKRKQIEIAHFYRVRRPRSVLHSQSVLSTNEYKPSNKRHSRGQRGVEEAGRGKNLASTSWPFSGRTCFSCFQRSNVMTTAWWGCNKSELSSEDPVTLTAAHLLAHSTHTNTHTKQHETDEVFLSGKTFKLLRANITACDKINKEEKFRQAFISLCCCDWVVNAPPWDVAGTLQEPHVSISTNLQTAATRQTPHNRWDGRLPWTCLQRGAADCVSTSI